MKLVAQAQLRSPGRPTVVRYVNPNGHSLAAGDKVELEEESGTWTLITVMPLVPLRGWECWTVKRKVRQ